MDPGKGWSILERIRKYLYPLLGALLVTILIAAGSIHRVDRWAQDLLYQRPGTASGDIVIIGIDEESLSILGPYNTWDRNILASVLEKLAADPEHLPAVTAVDILYAGYSFEQADARLAAAAEALGHVVTASLADFGMQVTWENGHAVALDASAVLSMEEPYPELAACTVQGHINAVSDADGIIRHALAYVDYGQDRTYSMACETARIYLESRGKQLKLPPVSRQGAFYIPYTARPGAYSDDVSIVDILMDKVPPEYWAGKIVLIGAYTPGLQDDYFTPVDTHTRMNGVEIQANVIQSLLDGRYKREVPAWPQLLILFLVSLSAAWLFLRLRLKTGTAVFAGYVLAGFGIPLLLYQAGYVTHPLWIPSAMLVLFILALAVHYVLAARERIRLALENERIHAELEVAAQIQSSALPGPLPEHSEFTLSASMTPAKMVGGDLYDYFMIDEDHLGLVIGDVSGKGVPASLFMMVAASLIRNAVLAGNPPGEALRMVNTQMCARNPNDMFVTVWLGVLELSTGLLTAVNAGHEYPALKKASGTFELFKDRHGFVIGGMDGVRYRPYTLQLEAGDTLFVYTDGVPEATSAQEELFGTDRMLQALRSRETGTPDELLEAVRQSIAAFVGPAPQFDDLTMLCIRYLGRPTSPIPT